MGAILTTTIGSFPKPDYLPVKDWFDASRAGGSMNSHVVTRDFKLGERDPEDENLFQRAAKEIIDIQTNAGIDIPTDGEVRRENYIHYHCRFLKGFDFKKLEHRMLRNGAYEADLPAINAPVTHSGVYYAPHDWRTSQALTSRPVKFTIPGPLTIMDTNADCFYNDRSRLNKDLAETVNKEILALVDAGCMHIQVDEPLFARQVEDALSFGIEGLERCFHKVPKGVKRVVHICCGYPNHLDDFDYKKAAPENYHRLAKEMDRAAIDQISLEDAHCYNDLGLLELFQNKTVILGTIAIASSKVETMEEVVTRLRTALEHIDRNRLMVAPDCGLGLLTRDLAEEKLKILAQATKSV